MIRSLLARGALVAFALLLSAASSFAQEPSASFVDGETMAAAMKALGFMFQAGVVWFLVFLIRKWKPVLKERYPLALMALAAVIPAAIGTLEVTLSSFFGTPISLQSIVDALGNGGELGVTAIVMDQVGKQLGKQAHAKRYW